MKQSEKNVSVIFLLSLHCSQLNYKTVPDDKIDIGITRFFHKRYEIEQINL